MLSVKWHRGSCENSGAMQLNRPEEIHDPYVLKLAILFISAVAAPHQDESTVRAACV